MHKMPQTKIFMSETSICFYSFKLIYTLERFGVRVRLFVFAVFAKPLFSTVPGLNKILPLGQLVFTDGNCL